MVGTCDSFKNEIGKEGFTGKLNLAFFHLNPEILTNFNLI